MEKTNRASRPWMVRALRNRGIDPAMAGLALCA
jgi:hypothetical protein